MKITVFALQGDTMVTGGPELLDHEGVKWVDVEDQDEAGMAELAKRYGLHPLAVEDTLHLDQRPKLEEYPTHAFVVLQGFEKGADVCEPRMVELHFFLGNDWLITAHETALDAVVATGKRVLADPTETLGRGPDFCAYMLADSLVDQHFPLFDALDEELENLETAIFLGARREQLRRVFELKRMTVALRRVLSPQRDVVGLLSRRGLPQVSDKTTLYFRDVYDHLARLHEQIADARDVLTGVTDGYLSMQAQRTNDVSKQLTVIATIFLPLSFITGFFGQNFEGINTRTDFWLMIFSIIAVPAGMFAWFKRKGWLERDDVSRAIKRLQRQQRASNAPPSPTTRG